MGSQGVRDVRCASRNARSVEALAKKLLIAVLAHPACTSEMRSMDTACAVWFFLGVDAEEDFDRFLPIGPICIGVEKAHVELHVLPVILRKRIAGGWFI